MRHIIMFSLALFFGQLSVPAPSAVPQRATAAAEAQVYICTGGSSKRYHKHNYCKGLDNCKGTVKKVSLSYAEDTLKRTPCKICYKKK